MYHQPADEYSPDWDFTGIAKDAALLHAVGERLANSHAWPNWSQDSEFRAARDQTAAERGEAPAPSAPPPATTPRPGERG
jgi:Zn-dependent M28 family amino/carboxypeptidase